MLGVTKSDKFNNLSLDKGFVDIAPEPVFPWLEGLHNWMTSRMEMSHGVLVF
jgi:hypothetical protein